MRQNFQKALRDRSTPAEIRLWYLLRNRRLQGLKFRRQVPIGKYIADFVCHEKRLIIECDGGGHNESQQMDRDAVRTYFLSGAGYRVIRFWNDEILQGTERVLESILEMLSEPSLTFCAQHPEVKGFEGDGW